MDRLLGSESRTLRVLCFNVGHFDRRYQGKGIAKAMLECLKEWARQRGWRRIEAHSCPDITPTNVVGDWKLRRGPLERRGFYVLEQLPAPEAEVDKRLRVITDLAGRRQDLAEEDDWYVRNFARLAANPAWKAEYDKNYLMACDL